MSVVAAGLVAACVRQPPDRPDPAAEVDGEVITVAAVQGRLAADHDLANEVAGLDPPAVRVAERAVLQRMIGELLLAREAHRRGVSPEELRASIVRGVSATDAETERAYQLARAYRGSDPMLQRRVQRLLAGSESEARARVRAFVQQQDEWMAVERFLAPPRREAKITVHLPPLRAEPH